MYYKNVKDALKELRSTDKIESVLSNKFAIVKSLYENGDYSEPAICGLIDQKIKFFGELEGIEGNLKKRINTPKISSYRIYNKEKACYINKKSNNREFIKRARKLFYLLTSKQIISHE